MLSIRRRRPAVYAAALASATPLLGVALAANTTTTTRGADPEPVWVFEKIAATGDMAPSLNRPFDSFTLPSIDGDSVAFGAIFDPNMIKDDADDFEALYVRMNGLLRAAATPNNAVPGRPGLTFASGQISGYPYGVDADSATFLGTSQNGSIVDGVYRFDYPSTRTVVADTGDPATPSGSFNSFNSMSMDLGVIAFGAALQSGVSGFYLKDDMGLTRIADTNTVPPGSLVPFQSLLGGLSLRNGVVAFTGRFPGVLDALYSFKNGALTRVADENTPVRNTAGLPVGVNFQDFTVPGVDQFENIFFGGLYSGAVNGVFVKRPGAVPLPVADINTVAPGGAVNFTEFAVIGQRGGAIDMGRIAFMADTASVEGALYTDLGGSLKRVLAPGDTLDGRTVNFIDISRQSISKRTIALLVGFDDDTQGVYTATLQTINFETEPNNAPGDPNTIEILCDPQFFSGKLQENEYPECRPDTFLVVFDKQNNLINESNDDPCKEGTPTSSSLDDLVLYIPPAAPVFGDGGSGFVNNGDGTRSLRLGVTGFPDGFDGDFNGMFMNAPHMQTGGFTVCVTWKDNGVALPSPVQLPDGSFVDNPQMCSDEFVGGDAFRINFTVPTDADAVDVCVDNSTGRVPVCNDVDFFLLTNLIPNCPYCVEQIGGLTEDCEQTDLVLGWIDKTFTLLDCDDNGGEGVYAALCGENDVIADVNGRALIAVSGTGDKNFNGLKDSLEGPYLAAHPEYLDEYPGVNPIPPAPLGEMGDTEGAAPRDTEPDCVDVPPGHMICGCYTISVSLENHDTFDQPDQRLADSMLHGDINMDGVTDTADLGLLLGWFGWFDGN